MIHDDRDHVSGTASAPGDLPMPALVERQASRAWQFRHDNVLVPRCPRHGDEVRVRATSGVRLGIERAELRYTVDGSAPGEGSRCVPAERCGVVSTITAGYLDIWEATVPPQPEGTIVRYQIAGRTGDPSAPGRLAADGTGYWFQLGDEGLTTFAYRVGPEPSFPPWMVDAVVYQIFLDRFRPGPAGFRPGAGPLEKHGGSLDGVVSALPYLGELGVTALWLSPVGPSPSYHRYDQIDFHTVDEDLGGEAALRRLVEAANEIGMRMILDFVPSLGSSLMPQFVSAKRDRHSPWSTWFVFDRWPDDYRCFLGVAPTLVSLNGQDPSLRRHLIDAAKHWLVDVGFDGFRLDHALGQGSDFWTELCAELAAVKPEAVLFGEVTDTPAAMLRFKHQLPGLLDFPLANLLRTSVAGAGRNDRRGHVGHRLRAHLDHLAAGPPRVTFLDNHDMNRVLFEAGGDVELVKLAALCLFTLPHPPALYYGTEIGLSQEVDKDAGGYGGDHVLRPEMPWDRAAWNTDLLDFFRRLIAVRRAAPALRRGRWRLLDQPSADVVAYQLEGLEGLEGSERIEVHLNLGASHQTIDRAAAGGEVLITVGEVVIGGQPAALGPRSGCCIRFAT